MVDYLQEILFQNFGMRRDWFANLPTLPA